MFASRISQFERSPFFQVVALAAKKKDCIYLFAGEPDFPTPAHIIEAGQRALAEGYTHYGTDKGSKELRNLISEKIKKEWSVVYNPSDEILISAGAQAAIHSTIMSLIEPGNEAIIFSPYYPDYIRNILLAGGKPIVINLKFENGFIPDINQIRKHISPKTKFILLPSPNNPTGRIYPRELLSEIVELACKEQFYIITDEVYEKIIYHGNVHHSLLSFPEAKKWTIMINSFSKTYSMTGWRIGYAVAEKEALYHILKYHEIINICTNVPAQRAAIAALSGPQDCVKQMVSEYERRREFLIKELENIPEIAFTYPQGTFYLYIDIRNLGLSSQKMVEYLIEEGIVVMPGEAFGQDGFIRLSFSVSMEKLEKAMERFKTAVNKLQNK